MENHLELIKSGVSSWNAWRKENPATQPNLSGACLCEAILRGANLSGSDLSGANLSGANLSGAYLSGANLSGANLNWADISDADLNGADINEAKGVMLLFRDPRYQEKGYQLIRWTKDGEPWFNSGCHSLPKKEALRHWGSDEYPDRKRGQMYTDAIKKF